MGQRSHKLVMKAVMLPELPKLSEGLQAVDQLSLPTEDFVHENMRGSIAEAVLRQGTDYLVCLFHGILLQKLLSLRVIINLLGLMPRTRRLLARLLCFFLRLTLLLMFELLLLFRAQFSLGACGRAFASQNLLATSFGIKKVKIDFDSVLCCTPIKSVRVQPFLHPQHRNIRLQRRLSQTIIVKIKLILSNVVEVLEGLVKLLQRLPILFLPGVAATDRRLVPHTLHVVEVGCLL
mmetsp:Transcript_55853/g.104783  ORF Transcript_55853/g.104783 Transcript_55853/m.104783 type:complete len:235 (-) Transcript_55853:1721-2425(-)